MSMADMGETEVLTLPDASRERCDGTEVPKDVTQTALRFIFIW